MELYDFKIETKQQPLTEQQPTLVAVNKDSLAYRNLKETSNIAYRSFA